MEWTDQSTLSKSPKSRSPPRATHPHLLCPSKNVSSNTRTPGWQRQHLYRVVDSSARCAMRETAPSKRKLTIDRRYDTRHEAAQRIATPLSVSLKTTEETVSPHSCPTAVSRRLTTQNQNPATMSSMENRRKSSRSAAASIRLWLRPLRANRQNSWSTSAPLCGVQRMSSASLSRLLTTSCPHRLAGKLVLSGDHRLAGRYDAGSEEIASANILSTCI